MELDMVAYVEIDKVADIEVDMVADIDIDMEIQFGERFGHGGWLIGPKLFRPEAFPTCVSFFREITTCWPMRSMRVKAGVSAAMNAFLTRPSQTAAFFGRKTRYMFFPKSCVKNT